MADYSPLQAFLADPSALMQFDVRIWSLFLAEARACDLLPRIASQILNGQGRVAIPPRFVPHLVAARKQGDALGRDVRWEVSCLAQALSGIDAPVILLKGAAYVIAELPPARGRIFSDVDILVRRERISDVESALLLGGWASSHLDAYDQRYYREWSHEIPPMTHRQRQTTVDLHHSLVMPTCRIKIDSARMLADAVPISGQSFWWRLNDEDLVLHAASHLFLNSEFDHGLRDLGDIDLLLRHFDGISPGFAQRVRERAIAIGMGAIAEQCLSLCWHYFRTPGLENAPPIRGLLCRLFAVALATRHPDTRPWWQSGTESLLMLRELSMRLPVRLLIRHLVHKAGNALKPAGEAVQ